MPSKFPRNSVSKISWLGRLIPRTRRLHQKHPIEFLLCALSLQSSTNSIECLNADWSRTKALLTVNQARQCYSVLMMRNLRLLFAREDEKFISERDFPTKICDAGLSRSCDITSKAEASIQFRLIRIKSCSTRRKKKVSGEKKTLKLELLVSFPICCLFRAKLEAWEKLGKRENKKNSHDRVEKGMFGCNKKIEKTFAFRGSMHVSIAFVMKMMLSVLHMGSGRKLCYRLIDS